MNYDAKRIYNQHYKRLKQIAMDCFKWEGLPKHLNTRIVERFLYNEGEILFYKDEKRGLTCLPCTQTNKLNILGEPTQYKIYGVGYSEMIDADKGCRVLNNLLGCSSEDIVRQYAYYLTECDLSIIQNVKQQKFPYLFITDQKTLLSFKNMYKQIDEGQPCVYGTKQMDIKNIEHFNSNVPFAADKTFQAKRNYENEIFSMYGVNNANTDKKERLITDEVNSNNQYISRMLDIMYESRLEGIELTNEKFGSEISLIRKENENNGELYDRTLQD